MLWLKVFTGTLNHKNPRNPTSPSNHTVYFKESVPFRRNCLVFRKWRSGRCVPMISQRNQINTLPGKPVLPEEQLHSAQGERTHKTAPPWQAPSFFFLIKLKNKGRWQPPAQSAWDGVAESQLCRAPVLSPGARHEEALLSEGSQKGPDLARKAIIVQLLVTLGKGEEMKTVPFHITLSSAIGMPTIDWIHRVPGSLPWMPNKPRKTVMPLPYTHAYNPSTWEVKAGRRQVLDKHGLQSKLLSQR